MAGRWAAASILVAMLLVVGLFLWAAFRPGAPIGAEALPVTGEMRFAKGNESWRLAARAARADRGTVALTVSATDMQDRPIALPTPPTAVLRMLDMAMAPERMTLVPAGAGAWRGNATLSMAGRWMIEVELSGERLNLVFEAGAR